MPSVKSVADLKKMALSMGGTLVFDDGTQFNASGAKKQTPDAPAPKPKQEMDAAMVARMLADALRSIQIPAPAVQVTAPAADVKMEFPEFPEPPKEWRFTVKRDKDGYITDILARATK